MKIAVEGCCHGELDTIYETLVYLEKKNSIKVDLLLICGDFQSVRNKADMRCMAVPPKHQKMNTFYKYYSGEKTAPVLTVFIGGNHEASNYLQELPYGGWVAPKIYYMGYANVLQFGGIRIGGISGIYKGRDYMKGHYEHPPYTEDSKRSAYHIRVMDVFRLKQLKQPLDIFLSHDWPKGIHKYGNVEYLLRKKSYFKEEVEKDELGNPIAAELLYQLQPAYWFSAHLHVKFPALVQHSTELDTKLTRFLALDKCLPKRQFLQVLDLPHDANKPLKLQLDPEWLAILKSTNHLLSLTRSNHYPGSAPGERSSFSPTKAEMNAVIADFGGDLSIPDNFEQTVPVFDPNMSKKSNAMPDPTAEINPQTTLICTMLDLTDPNAVFLGKDSTIPLPDDPDVGGDKSDENDDDQDDVDDYESEQSFISLTESERSFSDRSLSFLSVGNDSFTSIDNIDEGNVDLDPRPGKAGKSLSMNDMIDKDEDDEFKEIMQAQHREKSIRRSLSESLPRPKMETNKSDSASSSNLSQCDKFDDNEESDLIDDPEMADILAAQKLEQSKDDIDSESDKSKLSDTSLDCKSLQITDTDPELQEMLQAQKEASLRKADTVEVKSVMEISADSSDVDLQEIEPIRKQLDDSDDIDDGQPDFKNLRPTYQSSPLVSIDDRADQSIKDKDLSPQFGKGSLKRGDKPKTMESPATKKFRRRNQDMYLDTSTGEDDA